MKLQLFSALLLTTTTLSANLWRPVIGIEAGAALSSHAGKSKTFPVTEPGSQEFYKYRRHHKLEARGIFGGFVGAKWKKFAPWELLFTLNYNESSPFSVAGTLTQGVDAQSEDSYHYQYKIFTRQLLVEGKFSYMTSSRFSPFVLVGMGPSFNKAYSFSTSVPSTLTFTREYKNHTATGFTYLVGAGSDFLLTSYARFGLSYRFTDLGKAKLGRASIDDTHVSGTLCQNHFYASELLAALTFNF